ncbi:MAG: PAS domain S-box protein [Anaerolineaceae bacterium]
MLESAILGIIQNGSLLLAAAMIFYVSKIPWSNREIPFLGAHLGVVVGGIGITIIASAWVYRPGIIFDTSSILLATAGLFLGLVPTLIAMVMMIIFRIFQGGSAVIMGAAIILSSGVIGILCRQRIKNRLVNISLREAYLFGVLVHIVTLLATFTLPLETALDILSIITIPVLILYPVATARLGLLLANRLKQDQVIIKLKENEEHLRSMTEMLQKSENHYRLLTEKIKDVVWIYDVDAERFTFVSPSIQRLRGYNVEEILSQPITESILERDREKLLAILKERTETFKAGGISSEDFFTYEMEQPCKDGSTLWTELIISFYLSPDNGHIEIRGVTHDISERKAAEESLRRKDQLYKAIIENAPDGIAMISVEGKFVFVSPAARKMFGYSEDEPVLDISPDESTHPEDLPAVLEVLARVVQNPSEVASIQYRFRRKDGVWRWIESVFSNLHTDPETHVIVINFRDTTERKQAEDALRESERKFRQIFETTTTGISLLNARGQFLSGNPAILNLLGYTEEEYSCLSIDDISHPDDLNIDIAAYQELWQGKRGSYTTEKRNISKTGEAIWGQLTCTIVKDREGNPQYAIGMFENIDDRKRAEEKVKADQTELQSLLVATEQSRRALLSMVEDQKMAEEKIRQLNAELELRVRDRTAQLQTANRELEAFSYSVSHDLRAPLRALDGFSSILLSEYSNLLDEKGHHYLNRIQEASRKMGQLINDLLSLSRVTRTEFVRQEVDLSEIAKEIAVELKSQEPEREIELTIESGLVVEGDTQLLKIALGNLLSNAIKFTKMRKTAKISVGMNSQAGERVFYVRDNGAGFEMGYSKKLFTPFQRLHGANEFPGTGIGLVIVQRIINRHGGRIWPEAKVNKGATFFFTLGGG